MEANDINKQFLINEGILDISLKLIKDFSKDNIDFIQLKNLCFLFLYASSAKPPLKFEDVSNFLL